MITTVGLVTICSHINFVHSLRLVQLFVTPWTGTCQASLFFTISWSLLKLMSIESVMPSNHLVICHPLLLLPSMFPSITVFSNESDLPIRWPKYWSFSFSISLYWVFKVDLLSVQFSSVQFSRSVISNSLRSHESQHARPPHPSPTPGVHSNSRPSS